MKLLMLKGLQASGKSYHAKKLASKGWTRVNKDDLRAMLHNSQHSRPNEKQVVAVRDLIIQDALSRNKNVVVDDTNFNPVHEKRLRQIAREYKAEFSVDDSFLETPLSVCIERDLKRQDSVGERIIRETYYKYVAPPHAAQEFQDDSLPRAYIVDIDGTLAHMVDRKPYEWGKVGGDIGDTALMFIIDALNQIKANKYVDIILLSGREDLCRKETEEWLDHWCIEYNNLYMRKANDKRDDTIVKRELYEKYIKGKYNVLSVIDDRPKVCRMWRDDLGLKVMQVGDPHYEF